MRRFLSFLFILLIPFMTLGAVTYSDGVKPDLGIEEMISSLTNPRGDVNVEISRLEKGEGRIALSIIVGDEEMSFVAKDEEMLYRMLRDALFSSPVFLKDSLSVESVYGNLVSSDGVLPKGKLYYAVDMEGSRRALLRATEKLPEDKTLLTPIMRRDLYPGYTLEEGPVVALDLSIASPLTRPIFDISLSLRMVSLLEFLDPLLSLNYIYRNGVNIAQVGIGIETHAELSKMTTSSFTLLEDGEIFASVEALFGYGRGKFLPGVTYTIGYGHYYLPNAYWRIGYSGNLETGSELRIAGGVLL